MKERVLVTGGAGYIGSILCERLLDKGYNVTALDKLVEGSAGLTHLISREGFEFIYGDVRDESKLDETIPNHDVIIPLAGIVGMPQCRQNPIDAVQINRDAVLNINKMIGKNQRILYPNTNSGYGVTTGEIYCTEETPLNPISLYGKTKCEAEKAILENGGVTFRLATTFGMSPKMRWDVMANNFVQEACARGYIVVFEKDFKRNFVHVKDVADAFIHGIENYENMRGKAYNLGIDSANISKQQLCELIRKYVPKFNVVYQEIGSDVDKRNYIVSNQRLREAGFEAQICLEKGILEMVKGFRLQFAGAVFRQ